VALTVCAAGTKGSRIVGASVSRPVEESRGRIDLVSSGSPGNTTVFLPTGGLTAATWEQMAEYGKDPSRA
jgi:hypothetical protein